MRNSVLTRLVGVVNNGVAALVRSPRVGAIIGRGIVLLTYTGRRSGRTFTIPVGYRRSDDRITIPVEFADAKNWWRNFLDDGGSLSLHLDGADRPGHGVARRYGRRAIVTVRLTATLLPVLATFLQPNTQRTITRV